ncbi:MAG TPA: M48 family metallopeptidase [Anaerolineales bacterium]
MTQIDTERQQQAREYARSSRQLWLVNMLLTGTYVVAWIIGGWGVQLRTWLISLWTPLGNAWLLPAAFALVFGGILSIIGLPLAYYGGFVLPHRYGQSNQSLRDWVVDQLKGLLIGAPIGLLLLELMYFALRAAGEAWWLWAAGGLLIFNVLLSNLAPILIMPLFNKYVPLGEEHADLAKRLMDLAARAGTQVRGVYKFDLSRRTKSANAALTGIGNTRRIILGDTMIKEFTPDEIETVLAHELGHQVHRDILIYIVLGFVTTLVGLYLAALAMHWAVAAYGYADVSDPAALPALALILGLYGLLTMPIENAISRWREGLADEYALDATGKKEAFASAFARLANQNLSEVDPAAWVVWMFYSHPPLGERIAAARAWSASER